MTNIHIYNSQRDLCVSKIHMKQVVSFLLQELNITTDEISVHFVTERAICKLHQDFFDDPTPTDCITIPLDGIEPKKDAYHILGEAFICPKTALLYANRFEIDPQEEVYRYVVHCLLHLIGYTDKSVATRAKMKKKENACLKKLLLFVKLQTTELKP